MNGTNQDQCNRIYTSLAVIQNMLSAFGFEKFGEDIQALFDKYPVSKLFYASMGFPERWNEERLFFYYLPYEAANATFFTLLSFNSPRYLDRSVILSSIVKIRTELLRL